MSVLINYKNNEILSIPSSGDYKLNTKEKYLEDDIRIIATELEDGDEIGYGSNDAVGAWYFNETLDFSSGFEMNPGVLNFTSNNSSYTRMSILPPYFMLYGSNYAYFAGSWENQAYRTITITGGTDATNPDLVAWLETNATRVTT